MSNEDGTRFWRGWYEREIEWSYDAATVVAPSCEESSSGAARVRTAAKKPSVPFCRGKGKTYLFLLACLAALYCPMKQV